MGRRWLGAATEQVQKTGGRPGLLRPLRGDSATGLTHTVLLAFEMGLSFYYVVFQPHLSVLPGKGEQTDTHPRPASRGRRGEAADGLPIVCGVTLCPGSVLLNSGDPFRFPWREQWRERPRAYTRGL